MPNKKISQLTTATTPLTGTEQIPIVQGGQTLKATTQDIADLAGGGGGVKKYVALLTQSGTDAPVATVLENTLGSDIVWSYDGVGLYIGTSTNLFNNPSKVGFLCAQTNNSNNGITFFYRETNDDVRIETRDYSFVNSDDVLSYSMIEIRVYP